MPEVTFRFLDLPAEIRNLIYQMLLPESGEINVNVWRRRVGLRYYFHGKHEIRNLARLLQANRQMRDEVAPVLYGTVVFQIWIRAQTIDWLKSMGSMNQHIRHIHLQGWTKNGIRSGLHQLKQARFLKTITLAPHFQTSLSTAVVAEALRPLLKAIQKQQAHDSAASDIAETIRVKPAVCGSAVWVSQQNQRIEEYNATLQAELKKMLA